MKNTGIILEDRHPGDYVYSGVTSAPIKRTVLDWSPYLPDGELQYDTLQDFMNCVTFSAIHVIETQVNKDINDGKYKQEALDYFESAGYLEDGKFRCSVRYSSTMNGTTKQGQYMSVAGEGIRTHDKNPELAHGLLPNKDLPMLPNMTWEEYYAPITADLILKAKKIYDYMDITYNWVDQYNIPDALLNAPIQVATAVCPVWEVDTPIKACGGACAHCTAVYGEDLNQNYLIRDHYLPYDKKLASNYHIFSAMQYVVLPKFPPKMFATLLAFIKKYL